METKINLEYKKVCNLGYEIAKELNWKEPMFKGQNAEQTSTNAIQAGIFEYVQEVKMSTNINIKNSVGKRLLKSNLKKKGKNKNRGKGLSF